MAEFGQETVVALRDSGNPFWLITEGPVPGFPGAPRIFISKSDVEEEAL